MDVTDDLHENVVNTGEISESDVISGPEPQAKACVPPVHEYLVTSSDLRSLQYLGLI